MGRSGKLENIQIPICSDFGPLLEFSNENSDLIEMEKGPFKNEKPSLLQTLQKVYLYKIDILSNYL